MESVEDQFLRRAKWLIQLRWIACVVVLSMVLLAVYLFRVPLPLQSLLLLNFILALYNSLLTIVLHRMTSKISDKAILLLRWQVSIDYILLACFLHYSGGIENPFAFYFIFHVVISSIVFERKTAFLQTTFGVFLFSAVVLLEFFEIIPHFSIFQDGQMSHSKNPIYLFAISSALISSLYFATYLASGIGRQLRRRERECRNANTQLTEQDRRKSEYVIMILHDLKEPIATVQNCIQLVLGGFCGDLDTKAKQTLSRASKWTQKMIHLTHDLLSLSKIRILPLVTLKPILLNKEIHSILDEHRGKFKDKSLQTRFAIPDNEIWIGGDEEIFNHIFTNLISNAIKYTPVGGTIGASLTVHNNWVTLDVWDTGIGIPQEYQKKVFDDFFRTPEAIDIDASGTGLGLAVIKHGVELFGGSVQILSPHEREPGQKVGTCFCLEFPVVERKTEALEK